MTPVFVTRYEDISIPVVTWSASYKQLGEYTLGLWVLGFSFKNFVKSKNQRSTLSSSVFVPCVEPS